VGRLLGGPVDTIAVEQHGGGDLGSSGASLQLVHVGSGYSGTLRLQAWIPGWPHMSTDTSSRANGRHCDTTVTATMSPSAAKRLFALLRPAVIEAGEAPEEPIIYDVVNEYSYRLTSGGNSVVVDKRRTLRHGETRYRAPVKQIGPTQPPWAAFDMKSPLVKAHEMLQPYLQPDRLNAFYAACRGG
jgi:hypothetical protein